MGYKIKLEKEYIEKLESEEKYSELIQLLLDEIRYNYENIKKENKNIDDIKEIYESISFLGKNKELKKQTMINMVDYLKINRENFIKIFSILEK